MAGRGLVLGGGGITGIAWQVGLLAGLAKAGVDLAAADEVIGTSAGALVGVQLTSGVSLAELYRRELAPDPAAISVDVAAGVKLRYAMTLACSRTGAAARVRLGRLARAAPPVPEQERREVMRSLLPRHDWPEQRLLITAVDADSGECVVFSRGHGVSLIDAVAASCAVPGVWPPVPIGGRHWMDGGMRTATNADLAWGCDRIVVLAPVTRGWGAVSPGVLRQCDALVRNGHRVALLSPDRAALTAIGTNMLSSARRAAAARAGYAQAASLAEAARAVWSAQPRPVAGPGLASSATGEGRNWDLVANVRVSARLAVRRSRVPVPLTSPRYWPAFIRR